VDVVKKITNTEEPDV